MQLVEIRNLQGIIRDRGIGHASTVLVHWDEGGYVLMIKYQKDVYLLRVRHTPTPRIFKNIHVALTIAEELGFASVTVVFTPQKGKTSKLLT